MRLPCDLGRLKQLVQDDPILRNAPNDFVSWLHVAAAKGQLNIVKFLVENGAEINLRDDTFDAAPLNEAILHSTNLELVRYLLVHGAELDVSKRSRNPLMTAIYSRNLDMVKLLLDAGIDLHISYIRESNGEPENALAFAKRMGAKEIYELLLARGCTMPEPQLPFRSLPPQGSSTTRELLRQFLSAKYGPVEPLSLQEIVPLHDSVHVEINLIRPTRKYPYLTLFTTGMSDEPLTVPQGKSEWQFAELIMHLPPKWPDPMTSKDPSVHWPLRWLRDIAYYPHLNETWLGAPYTIISSDEPPVPLGSNTDHTCLLLIADAGNFPPLKVGHKTIHYYTMNTLHTAERDYEKKHGWKKLFELLSNSGMGRSIDPNRKNAASH